MPSLPERSFDAVFEAGVDWRPIAPQARLIWTIAAGLTVAPLLIFLVFVLAVGAGVLGLMIGVVGAGVLLALLRWLVVRRHRSWGYQVHEDELVVRRGVLFRKLTIVPIGRMQFIDIQQGPLDRRFGVANLQMHTAAAASDAKVAMLPIDAAGRLRDELTSRGAGRSGGT